MNDELVLNNVNLIYFVLKKLELFEKKDLYEEIGMIALVRASQKYEPKLGTFSTFASKYIKNEILRYIQIQNYKKRKCDSQIISLDSEILNQQRTMHEIIPDNFNLEEELEKKEQIELLYRILSCLSEEEQFIINKYFGLRENEKITQKEIAQILGISPNMVKYKMNKSFKIIKKIMEDKYGE